MRVKKNLGDRIMRDSILHMLNWDIRHMKMPSKQLDIWILIPDRDVWADKIWWYHLTDVVYTYKISLGH